MPLGRVEEGPRGTDRVDGEKLLEKHNGFAPLGLFFFWENAQIILVVGDGLVLDFEKNLGGW